MMKNIRDEYTKLIKNNEWLVDNSTNKQWQLNDLCIMKHPIKMEFSRCKILEYKANVKKYKLINLDNGQYETSVDPSNMFTLIDKLRSKPVFLAKRCMLVGVEPVGASNGKWSSMACDLVAETLNDAIVQVEFLGINNSDLHQISIYIDSKNSDKKKAATTASSLQQTLLFPKQKKELLIKEATFVRYQDILSKRGVALLSEIRSQIENLLDKSLAGSKSAYLLARPSTFDSYPEPELPKKVYKNVQNNYDAYYDVFVNNIEKSHLDEYFALLNFVKIVNSFKNLNEMKNDFEKCYTNSSFFFELDFIEKLLDSSKYQACVCKLNDGRYYRGEIVARTDDEHIFKVRIVDYGFMTNVHHQNVYRPMIKYLNLPKQAFRIKIGANSIEPELDQSDEEIDLSPELKDIFMHKLCKLRVDTILNAEDDEEELILIGDLFEKKRNVSMYNYLTKNDIKIDSNFIFENEKGIRKYNKLDMACYLHSLVFSVLPSWCSIRPDGSINVINL
jgi:hypothetical protein